MLKVGETDDVFEGIADGEPIGFSVGLGIGATDGFALILGDADAALDGLVDDDTVGISVGPATGAAVG